MKTIVLCGSITAYQKLMRVKYELERLGFGVEVPELAKRMEKVKRFDLVNETFEEKVEATKSHFKKISQSEAILVVNEPKNGFESYVGPAVLMEMAVAFYLHKNIYLVNAPDRRLPNITEVDILQPKIIDHDFSQL